MVQSATDTSMLARYGQRQPAARPRNVLGYGSADTASRPRTPQPAGPMTSLLGRVRSARDAGVQEWGDRLGGNLQAYLRGYGPEPTPPGMLPTMPRPSGGGRGGGGGGGGGGGAPAMDQGTLNAMLAALGRGPQQMGFTPLDLPDYQGTPLSPFSTAPWDTMRSQVDTAAQRDREAAEAGYGRLASTLGANFMNPYTNAPVQASPQVQNAMINLMQKSGAAPGAGNEAINAENAYSQNSDAAFANLLGVLGAGAQQSQASRMAQVAMDANTAQQGIGAQAAGMRSAADVQQAQGQQNWQQRADDRAYQDAQLRQQQQQQEMMQNWQAQQAANQYNTTTANQFQQNQLGPLLELIGSSNGAGLDLTQLLAMLGGQ